MFVLLKDKFFIEDSQSHTVIYVLHLGVNLRLLVSVPLCTCIGGVAKCVGDVAMCVGDHVKVLIFLCFFNTGAVICTKTKQNSYYSTDIMLEDVLKKR